MGHLSYSLKRTLLRSRALVPGLRARHRREAMVGPLGHWKELGAYQLSALRSRGLLPAHHLLDIGCGPLQGGIEFIRYLQPSRYVGVDLNPRKLAEGYAQVAELQLAGRNPRLVVADDFGRSALNGQRFDFVWASQILYYFDETRLLSLLALVADHLAPGGKLLGDIVGDPEPEFRTPRHLLWISEVQAHSPEQLHTLAQRFGLAARSLGPIRQFGYPSQLNLRSNLLIEFTRP